MNFIKLFFVSVSYELQTLWMIEEVIGGIVKKHGEIDFECREKEREREELRK